MEELLATTTVSMSDFKRNPARVLREAGSEPVAVLNHNKPAFYMIEPKLFEALIDQVEDAQWLPLIKARVERGDFVDVSLDDL